jgi:hypothetical protein
MARRTKNPGTTASAPARRALRRLSETFHERRFEAEVATPQYVWVILVNLGAIALGAGFYGQFFVDPAISYAPFVMASGVVLVAAYLLFGSDDGTVLVVGELGLGFEQDGKTSRTRWYEVEGVALGGGLLKVETTGKPINVPLKQHAPAARRIVAEALKRLPKRVELDDEDVHGLGEPNTKEGDHVEIEPPQVTNQFCSATDKALTFEKDVRMCSRCGALYHRAGVPRRCGECDKKLKK